jgi:alkylglycerol monooxygenase
MMLNYLAFAVPFFLFFIGLEYIVAKWKNKDYYEFSDSIANLSIGIAERLSDTLTVVAFHSVYLYLHQHYAIWDIKPSILMWVLLFLATDFVWYWYHRLAHEVNLLWSVHVIHHQSDNFNYTVSTRITIFQAIVRTAFWSILPVIGFPPEMITVMLLIHGTYPFFTHTRLIGKLGILEYLFVTPSHHAVHHASNEEYLDKNYGDMLIIWDKLFGTFVEEKAEPTFGLTKPLGSSSFLWQYFHFFLEMLYTARRTEGWINKLKVIFGKPDLVPAEARDALEKRFLFRSEQSSQAYRFKNYVLGQIVAILVILFVFILFEAYIPFINQLLITGVILLTLINCGAILEQRLWVFHIEYVRGIFLALTLFMFFPNQSFLLLMFVVALGILLFSSTLRERYLQLIYG